LGTHSALSTHLDGDHHFNSEASIAELVSFLRTAPLFAGVSETDLLRLASSSHRRVYKKGVELFSQGEPLRKVFLIFSGTVKLTYSDLSGSQIILALRSRGEILYLPTGSAPQHHTAAAETVTFAKVLAWKADCFEAIVHQTHALSGNIAHILSSQLVDLERRYYEAACEKVERRVASTLIRLASQIGSRFEHGVLVPISRQDLAELTGTNLFSVSRLISRWVDAGLMLPSRRAVIIPSLEALDLATLASVKES